MSQRKDDLTKVNQVTYTYILPACWDSRKTIENQRSHILLHGIHTGQEINKQPVNEHIFKRNGKKTPCLPKLLEPLYQFGDHHVFTAQIF